MTRVFIRGEDDCGRGKLSAQEYINQFKTPVLFGRTDGISQLNNAWIDPNTHLFHIDAPTGAGKTALVNKWLYTLQKKDWHDAENVYMWTFYPADLTRPLQNPVDSFFAHALQWFGDAEATRCPNLLQGKCLASLVQAHHTLLVLDGLEALQFASGSMAGQITDPRLQTLLALLDGHNPGLCVTTSTRVLVSPESSQSESTRQCSLDALPVDDCVQLLRYKGVQCGDKRLQQIVRDYGQHPFTLMLLGGYLNIWHSGDWRQMEKIPVLMDKQAEGRQARRIMVANSAALQGTAGEALIYLLSLLYQPIHIETIRALADSKRSWPIRLWGKRQDTWADLVKPLMRQGKQQQQHTIRQLQELGLLADTGRCLLLPQWVREAFRRQFKYDWPNAWKEANQQLIAYSRTLKAVQPEPVTMAEAAPLPEPTDMPAVAETVPSAAAAVIANPEKNIAGPVADANVETAETAANAEQQVTAVAEPAAVRIDPVIEDMPVAEGIIIEPVIEAILPETVASKTEPAKSVVVPIKRPQPVLNHAELEQLDDLAAQLEQFRSSMQMLQIRTRKFQKHIRQLDKEIKSMQYPPQRKTGTDG